MWDTSRKLGNSLDITVRVLVADDSAVSPLARFGMEDQWAMKNSYQLSPINFW